MVVEPRPIVRPLISDVLDSIQYSFGIFDIEIAEGSGISKGHFSKCRNNNSHFQLSYMMRIVDYLQKRAVPASLIQEFRLAVAMSNNSIFLDNQTAACVAMALRVLDLKDLNDEQWVSLYKAVESCSPKESDDRVINEQERRVLIGKIQQSPITKKEANLILKALHRWQIK